jgi:DNA-binding transcriptional LysR family regulator
MRLEHFRFLLEINRQRSISAAARFLYMGQTTLSSIVKSVEKQLGFSIFQRAPNGVVATDKGERLMALAWEIEVKYEELLTLKDRQVNAAPPIVVSLAPSVNIGASIPLMERFCANDTHSTLIFEEHPRLDVCHQILQNNANIGVTYLKPEDIQSLSHVAEKNKVIIKPMLEDRFYLVANKKHPLASRAQVSLSELYDESLAMATPFRVATDNKTFASLNRGCSRITSFPTIHMIKDAILEQNMVSILTGFAIYRDTNYSPDNFGVVELTDLDSSNDFQVCVLYKNSKTMRYPERILLRCVEEYFAGVSLPASTAAVMHSKAWR